MGFSKAQGLFQRYPDNPILTPAEWPYPANAVFNAAATEIDGQTLLLVRVEDMRGFSHLTVAKSPNGYTNWQIESHPALRPEILQKEEQWGIEDPRRVWLEEKQEYAIDRKRVG